MNSEALFRLLGDIDDSYVTGAEQPVKKRALARIWLPVAVCAAAVLLALPLLRTARPDAPALHSYTLSEQGGVSSNTTATGPVSAAGAGDQDQDMTAEELRQATGEVPGGALEPDPNVPAQQEAIDAYQRLLVQFEAECGPGAYPDWYGGAYIVNGDFLIVNITHRVEETLPDKSFYLQIQDWAGSTSVGFGGVKYSVNELRTLQAQVEALPELLALPTWGCGRDEQAGQVTLYLPSADEALLAALAKLDPEDDAIRVSIDASADMVTTAAN